MPRLAQAEKRRDAQGRTVMDKFAEERPLLRDLPERPFEPRLTVPLVADGQALVTYQGATYSLPSHWRLLDVTAYVGPALGSLSISISNVFGMGFLPFWHRNQRGTLHAECWDPLDQQIELTRVLRDQGYTRESPKTGSRPGQVIGYPMPCGYVGSQAFCRPIL